MVDEGWRKEISDPTGQNMTIYISFKPGDS